MLIYTWGFTDEAMMAKYLSPEPDLETLAEAHHTWHITNCSKLQRREHGPIFECGGFPWWVKF
jgi:ubiquitin carboxyl-terminal hydrolase 7